MTEAEQLQPMSAADWDAAYRRGVLPWDEAPSEELLRVLRHWQPAPATVIDLGCGAGTIARALAGLGYTVVGVDQSAVAIDLARSRTPSELGCVFLVADILDRDPMPDADLMVERGVLHTRCSDRSRTEFVAALARRCRPGQLWLHLGASASDSEGSTSFVYGPSALTPTDFAALVEPYFTIRHCQQLPYGGTPGETDFQARLAVLQRRNGVI
jgi:SAM-dependent methyltransferase